MNPTLQLILRIVCQHLNCSEAEMRLGVEDRATEARRIFLWLGVQLTEHSVEAIGLFIGRPPRHAHVLLAAVSKARENDSAMLEQLDELAVECVSEAQLRAKVGRMPTDHDPIDVARLVIAGRSAQIGASHLQHMASAYLAALDQLTAMQASLPTRQPLAPLIRAVAGDREVAGVIEAALALEDAQFSAHEAAAQKAFDDALARLIRVARSQQRQIAQLKKTATQPQTSQHKEPVHGEA